jgi:hypothetical protein
MKFHKYDPQTFLYVETVEAEQQPEHSVEGYLPGETEYYTIAFLDGVWVSVLRPEFEIIDNQIVEIVVEPVDQQTVQPVNEQTAQPTVQ